MRLVIAILLLTSSLRLSADDRAAGKLEEALAKVKTTIEKHDWDGLMKWTDSAYRFEMLGMGISESQFLAEAMNLNWENNSIASGSGGTIRERDLNRIKKVTWRTQMRDAEWTTVTGTVRLKGFPGKTLIISIHWINSGNGWRITGPLG